MIARLLFFYMAALSLLSLLLTKGSV